MKSRIYMLSVLLAFIATGQGLAQDKKALVGGTLINESISTAAPPSPTRRRNTRRGTSH